VSEVQTRFHVDPDREDHYVVERVQDVESVLEATKAAHNAGEHGSHDFRHAAELPMVLVEKYCNVNQITFAEFMRNPEHVKRMCNDPTLKHFRVWPGRV
jgi:hypothetical protein